MEQSHHKKTNCSKCGVEHRRHSSYCGPCARKLAKARRLRQGKTTEPRRNLKVKLCSNARKRARKAGMAANIYPRDLHWPTHCPVLGLPLDYSPVGYRGHTNAYDQPSLDRWDNLRGYEPGNVFVISRRANELKRDASVEELERIATYARDGVW